MADAFRPSASPASRCASKHTASPTVTISCAWCSPGRTRAVRDAYEVDMAAQVNDVWTAEFTPPVPGRYRYTVIAWVDHFESWRKELERREELNDIRIALQVGSALISEAADRASGADADSLRSWAALLRETAARDDAAADPTALKAMALDPARAMLVRRYADRSWAASAARELVADRKRAGFSSWYELFPRSAAPAPETARQLSRRRSAAALRGRHGLRRAVLSADSADRTRQPQGGEQRTAGAAPGMWAARGRSARPRAATRRCCRNSEPSRISGT